MAEFKKGGIKYMNSEWQMKVAQRFFLNEKNTIALVSGRQTGKTTAIYQAVASLAVDSLLTDVGKSVLLIFPDKRREDLCLKTLRWYSTKFVININPAAKCKTALSVFTAVAGDAAQARRMDIDYVFIDDANIIDSDCLYSIFSIYHGYAALNVVGCNMKNKKTKSAWLYIQNHPHTSLVINEEEPESPIDRIIERLKDEEAMAKCVDEKEFGRMSAQGFLCKLFGLT